MRRPLERDRGKERIEIDVVCCVVQIREKVEERVRDTTHWIGWVGERKGKLVYTFYSTVVRILRFLASGSKAKAKAKAAQTH